MRKFPLLAASIAAALSLGAHAAETTRYTILLDGGTRVAGSQTVTREDNGWVKTHFVFKDNGRGPETDERYKLNAEGYVSEFHVKGSSTFGSAIEEDYTLKGKTAQWKSTSESGKQTLTAPAMYVPMNGGNELIMSALALLQKSHNNSINLLPGGELHAQKIEELELSKGNEKRKVQLVAFTGLGMTPSFVWATVGDEPRTFAMIAPGYMTGIEEGWQEHGELLSQHQMKAEGDVLREMAHTLRHPLKGLTVIRNARVFDSEKAALTGAQDVYVLRGKITAVLPAGSPSPQVENEVDASGKVLLPGLFDMHGHISRWDGGLHLAAGVTTVRDMGNDNNSMQQMIDETEEGELLHAQVVPSGFLEGEGENSASQGFHVKDLAGAKNAIDWYAQHGYPQLKIYNSFPKEILKDTIAYAHSRGLRVSGHIPVFLRAQDAVDAGYDEIQHINQVLLNFLVEPDTDTRTLKRFYLPAEKVGDLDFDSKPAQDYLASLKSHKVSIDSTLATFAFLAQKDGEVNPIYENFYRNLPLSFQRGVSSASMKIPDTKTDVRYKKSYAKMTEFVGRMYKAGIPLVAGTDELPGFVLHSELEMYVKAGLTPAQALQVATLNGARYSGTLKDRGSITPGKLADLVLVDGDPSQNIGDIRKVAMVFTQGSWMSASEIHQKLGIKPFVASTPEVKAIKPQAVAGQASGGTSDMPAMMGHQHLD